MNSIWFLSEKRNLLITGFNKVEKDGVQELWVTEHNGASRKIAVGKEADQLEKGLLDIIWSSYPSIVTDGNGRFSTNVNLNFNQQEQTEEVGE